MLTVKTMTCIASNDGILQAFGVKMNLSLDAEDLITRNQTQKIKFSEKSASLSLNLLPKDVQPVNSSTDKTVPLHH